MALHPELPISPYAISPHSCRWFLAAEELRGSVYDKLLPPLVAHIREEVEAWRNADYPCAAPTSRALLKHWFQSDHLIEQSDASDSLFRYYFAQCQSFLPPCIPVFQPPQLAPRQTGLPGTGPDHLNRRQGLPVGFRRRIAASDRGMGASSLGVCRAAPDHAPSSADFNARRCTLADKEKSRIRCF